MANIWTKEQQKVIELRNRNILVSAAAGSGKTAVLVERILKRIMDKENPVDIDRLLIVTFTRAAAAEMRERIGLAIQKKLLEEPENEHLQRQETLLFHAQITTIDSFCQSVIRSHFHLINLDPAFSIMDEGERKLLLADTAKEVLEEGYETGTEEFYQFIECFASGKRDEGIPELILQLYEFAGSYPWPDRWLLECEKAYETESLFAFENAKWVKQLEKQIHKVLGDLEEMVKEALFTALSPEGPWMYEDALRSDQSMLLELNRQDSYCGLSEAFGRLGKFAVLSRKKDENVSDWKRERVKELRDRMKKGVQSLKEQFFYQTPEEMLSDMKRSRIPVTVLFELTRTFAKRFSEKKRERNLVDFSDLEHMALQILVCEENGEPVPTEAAHAYAARFEEIMIDEYQDSNLVQELLLTSVSRCSQGKNNIFMVGDVKQSIYRFRLARPELFMEKYDTYTECDSPCQKIELHKNFRSRKEVLDEVNFLFRKIMHRDLGNVEYDDNAALYAGAVFPEPEASVETEYSRAEASPLAGAEILLLDLDEETAFDGDMEENDRESEARMIGGKIKELVGKELVYDKGISGYRKVCYRDIVILLRSVTGWAEDFLQVLEDMGIPAYTGTKSGYFSAAEVQTVLALLKIMDNPRQDIPFTAVLTSPIGGFSTEELAEIRGTFQNMPFYRACECYRDDKTIQSVLQEKLEQFFSLLERFRSYVPYTPMHELIWKILDETGYLDYASAMPAGGQRRANLEMLAEKAAAYESTSYRGLFNFVRYIENLRKYEVDFGEAGTIGEEEDTVRIMSIHKSKGLEFPVVFAAGLGKNFNRQDSRGTLAIHPGFGVGCDCTDPELRVKNPTLLKKMIQRELALENLGEELRVLYVAFTRAKEKLYLTAGIKKMQDKIAKWSGKAGEERLSFLALSGAESAMEWVLRSVLYEGEEPDSQIPVTIYDRKHLLREERSSRFFGMEQKQAVLDGIHREREGQKELEEWLTQVTETRYPWEKTLDIRGKLSVSELKRQSQRVGEEETEELYPEQKVVPLIPDFLGKKEKSGAKRGTAVHHVLQKLDFEASDAVWKIQAQIEKLLEKGSITNEEAMLVNIPSLVHFFRTGLGKRAAKAQKRGELYREKQFVIGVKASEIREEWEEDELVLVQGIIDAWFLEKEEIVLIDYKTDRVYPGEEAVLVKRYRAQLSYYAQALEQMTGRKVKEKWIYSFGLQKEIAI